MSIITSFSMFFLSFFPLWISVVFIDGRSLWSGTESFYTEIISIILILVFTIFSVAVLRRVLNAKNKNGSQGFSLVFAKEEKTITSEYLLSYILPLFAFDFTVWYEVVLFLVFFSVLAVLCIRHNHFSVNIVLEMMNYRFYRCGLENEDKKVIDKIIISKYALPANIRSQIYARPINNEYSVNVSDLE